MELIWHFYGNYHLQYYFPGEDSHPQLAPFLQPNCKWPSFLPLHVSYSPALPLHYRHHLQFVAKKPSFPVDESAWSTVGLWLVLEPTAEKEEELHEVAVVVCAVVAEVGFSSSRPILALVFFRVQRIYQTPFPIQINDLQQGQPFYRPQDLPCSPRHSTWNAKICFILFFIFGRWI